ncbi:hypothetical protein OG889_32725 [Streptomyces sp. NBC_00481]|uniref:hypothetical protein n=1 Tax=Streptomyces sp. NBC_00481 TaxID=2975755 RepID=UPI002DDAAD22|nr:hypothetical protein [Streptomyces sp. NBC_00481]WRY99038.1 hypothetical protein OG889_32725 [Streptomyces sp. NBC_00481]
MTPGTPKLGEREREQWLRKLDRATTTHERSRQALDGLIADARTAGVPLTAIADHTPYSREWARKIADRVDEERAAATQGDAGAVRNESAGQSEAIGNSRE